MERGRHAAQRDQEGRGGVEGLVGVGEGRCAAHAGALCGAGIRAWSRRRRVRCVCGISSRRRLGPARVCVACSGAHAQARA